MSPDEVLDRYFDCVTRKDMDGLLAIFAEDAVIVTSSGDHGLRRPGVRHPRSQLRQRHRFTDHKPVNGRPLAAVLNSTDPDLSAFQSHGGKLIHYHGWNDPAIGPRNSINYYESVAFAQRPGRGKGKGEEKVGLRRTQDFYRLFMVPGMLHCGGGPGPNNFGQGTPLADADHDVVKALEQWVEHGIAPERIIATKYVK